MLQIILRILLVKVEVPVHVMVAYEGNGGVALLILNLDSGWR
jgi:hypothetical protein